MPAESGSDETIFAAALQWETPAQRAAYLEEACAGQPALRARVEALLRASDAAPTFLERPVGGPRPAAGETAATVKLSFSELLPANEGPGTKIGRYKLLQQIGEGGCGTVFMAEQEEPVRRRVAFKVIKLGMDTKSVVARFEAERQALALMDHPNIAKVLDAGATDSGRPYFVMELVRGIPITRYCDENKLDTQQRLDLFIRVCHAIQHAHQKGIIHRDIKPSNILVTLHDGVPVPKVIDFGIAKATEGRLTNQTLFTAFEQFIGTPAYMSPEQAEMSGLDIDTRSDIYSLGVLLYELLAGSTPFDAKELMASGIDAMRKIIREKEPQRPSTRLATLGADQLTTTARRRSAETSKLLHQLQGDLDWVVMKCLEKDRQRRYDTANGLAADLKRHLENEPVTARPPSVAYRFQKALRRNTLAFGAGAAVVAALVVGLAAAAVGWRQTGIERDRALQAKNQAVTAQQEAVAAQQEAEKSQQSEREQRQRAEQGEAHASRMLYTANMNLALQAWDQNNVARLRELLNETRESADRGFEWYYWQRQTHLELLTFKGHADGVFSVAFSPDGRRIVTGSLDKTAKVWEAASGRELLTLKGHGHVVSSVAFSPDGQRLVTGSWDTTAKVWEAASGRELLTLTGHRGPVWSVAFSPDSQRLVTGSWDQTARVWEAASGRELLTVNLKGHGSWLVACSPDGQRLVTNNEDQTATVWDSASGKELLTLKGHKKEVTFAAFSPDGHRIVTGSEDGTAKVWEAASGRELLTLKGHGSPVSSVAFSPDGQRIVTGSWDQTARVWEAASGRELLTLKGHGDMVRSVAFSPDGQRIVIGSEDNTAKVWEAATPQQVAAWQAEEQAAGQRLAE